MDRCTVQLNTEEIVAGQFRLRGIYEPAYGFVVVTEDGTERSISWSDVHILIGRRSTSSIGVEQKE